MHRRQFMKLSGLSASLLAAPALFGSARADDLGKISYQLGWIKDFQFSGEYVADTKKYYQDAGVDVDIVAGGPNLTVEPVLVSGKALIGQSSPDITAAANAKGAGLRVIGACYQKSPFCMISLSKTPMKVPRDMIGKKIGMQAENAVIWQAFLKINKIDPASLTTVPVQFDFAPLVSGEVDGFFGLTNDDVIHLQHEGHDVTNFLFADHGYKLMVNTYTVQADSLTDKVKRAQLIAFMHGDIRGWQEVIADPDLGAKLTVEVYGKGNGLDAASELASLKASNALMIDDTTKAHGLFWMSDEGIREAIETMAAAGVKATPEMFTNEILAEVYKGKATL